MKRLISFWNTDTTPKQIAISVLFAFVLQILSVLLHSNFLVDFLRQNLIVILIALLAINTTTISVLVSKLWDITRVAGGKKPSGPLNDMKMSIIEQLVLIIVSALLFVVNGSIPVDSEQGPLYIWNLVDHVVDITLIGILIFAVFILYDTAKAIFVIFGFENTQSGQDKRG